MVSRKLVSWALVLSMGVLLGIPSMGLAAEPSGTVSSTSDTTQTDDLSTRVEQTAADYDNAVSHQAELRAQIDDLNSQIADLETQLDKQRDSSDECLRSLYKYSTDTSQFLALLCNASDFSDAVSTIDYYNRLNKYNNEQIEETISLSKQLDESRTALEQAEGDAEVATENAATALADAQAARQEAQQRALEAAAAADANAAAATTTTTTATQTTELNDSANTATNLDSGTSAGNVSAGDVNWSSDKASFVAEWTPRINAYLDGSPTAGLGEAYAVAAWEYSVDPRWAPAISCIESSKGANCFRAYNAWGFFNKPPDFTSWENGIDRVVRSLGNTYGGYLTRDGAAMYCPSSPDEWYNNVSAEMAKI